MKNRQILNKNSLVLYEKCDSGYIPRTFNIHCTLKTGASVICYDATCKNGKRGVLKEFYPRDALSLVRREDGSLIHQSIYADAKQRYINACQAYAAPYLLLFETKKKTGSEDLATFTPSYDIYYGQDESDTPPGELSGAMYIFTPEQRVTTFEEICQDIHENPHKNPEQKLLMVMTAIESLAKCISALHCSGLLHRDIKPSNFGFICRRSEVLTQAISLFDIDSVCSVYDPSDIVMGTPHYLEPEALRKPATNQTDIFAIGATLFYAIAASEATEESRHQYIPAYYSGLSALLSRSHLLHASEANSHPRLKSLLQDILEQCLAPRKTRYRNCKALLDDLDKVMKWLRKEETLDLSQKKNTRLALQYHLYNHPLFEAALPDSSCTNVLVIGFGNYGQKFLDVCLQAGQMIDHDLHVTVVSDKSENSKQDPAIYQESRPGLSSFFSIGSENPDPTQYGSIRFLSKNLSFDKAAESSADLPGLFNDCRKSESLPQYIFIALGDDELNLQAAQACRQITDSLGSSCSINFIREKKAPKESFKDITPIYVAEDIKNDPSYAEIERMAFNVHLVWKNSLNLDMAAVHKEFRKPYNHDSCVSNVLSIRYKLHSLHIDLSKEDAKNAARLYARLLAKGEDDQKNLSCEQLRNQLIWIEHRRWVTEKLCDGWQAIRDLSSCIGGITKDERYKRHVCIVKSRPDQKLRDLTADYTDTTFWNSADDDTLAQLDDLDRMSVNLHRVYKENADKTRQALGKPSLSEMRALILPYPQVLAAFEEWASCIQKIWNKNREAIHAYAGLKDRFLSAAAQEQQLAVTAQVKSFETIFLPILSSMEYRSYKKTDEDLIDCIPFILTYSENISLIIPYMTGDNPQIFANVASATVINPQRILYLAYAGSPVQYDAILSSLSSVAEYMDHKHLRASVDLLLLCDHFEQSRSESELQQHLCRLTGSRIQSVSLIQLDPDAIQSVLFQQLSRKVKKSSFWAAEINNSPLSAALSSFSKARRLPAFCFESDRMRFKNLHACELFSYIRKKPGISVSDMLALNHRSNSVNMLPDSFTDIDSLWEQYSKDMSYRKNWKAACKLLRQHACKQNRIILLPACKKNTLRKEYQYLFPIECYRSVQILVDGLIQHHVLDQESTIRNLTSSSFEVFFSDRTGQKKQFDTLFANPYKLRNSDDFNLFAAADGSIIIEFDDLFTSGLNLQTEYMGANELASILSVFESKNYIRNLSISGKTCSFVYATKQIKHLLTSDKRILEAYIYHKLKDLGQFDDIVGGLKTDFQQRFGIVATKGFRSLFIQCIAEDDVQDANRLLSCKSAQKCGINELVVFVSDSSGNKPQVQNISKDAILISDINMIDRIGQFLLDSVTNRSIES